VTVVHGTAAQLSGEQQISHVHAINACERAAEKLSMAEGELRLELDLDEEAVAAARLRDGVWRVLAYVLNLCRAMPSGGSLHRRGNKSGHPDLQSVLRTTDQYRRHSAHVPCPSSYDKRRHHAADHARQSSATVAEGHRSLDWVPVRRASEASPENNDTAASRRNSMPATVWRQRVRRDYSTGSESLERWAGT
jgi:hypothetical protein